MLRATDISFTIKGKTLLKGINADFQPGVLNLVIGPNGAGKSTLIKILSGQLPGYGGQVLYNGHPANNYDIARLAQLRAVLSQNLELSFPLTVWEVVMMGRYPHFSASPAKKDVAACGQAMALFGVAGLAARNFMTLSGGEKQRVHFARVMAQIWYPAAEGDNRYLFLDEPLTFLDLHYQHQFMHQVKGLLAPDIVVVGVLHDLNLAAQYADHITLLDDGGIFCAGQPEQVLTKENISSIYKIEVAVVAHEGRSHFIFK